MVKIKESIVKGEADGKGGELFSRKDRGIASSDESEVGLKYFGVIGILAFTDPVIEKRKKHKQALGIYKRWFGHYKGR